MAGNDHRLGKNEAPPAIISIYLGEQLTEILEHLTNDIPYTKRDGEILKVGVNALPGLPKDLTDRNRTSPLAFTGNKFELRMVGSSQSLAGPNTMINAAVADVFSEVADRLEKAENVKSEAISLIKEMYSQHKRVVFNGNGYSQEWIDEAKRRGLPNFNNTVSALEQLIKPEFVEMFARHSIFSKEELESRLEVYLEIYSKQINIEAGAMVEMARRSIIPAVMRYAAEVSRDLKSMQEVSLPTEELEKIATILTDELSETIKQTDKLNATITKAISLEGDHLEQARFYNEKVISAMEKLRYHVDHLELYTDKKVWPFPSYEELLFKL